MARIRTIKPTFFRDHTIAELGLSARLTFIGLWTYVDDAGRGLDDPRLVKGDLWQLDDKHTVKKVDADLDELARAGRIERYTAGGRRYLRVVNWSNHQRINRPTESTIPASLSERSGRLPVPPGDDSRGERNKEGKGKGSDVSGSLNEPADTTLPKEQVEANVSGARSLRAVLRPELKEREAS